MSINNETIGISMEVAIAKSFGILINPDYEKRSEKTIVDLLIQNDSILKIFKKDLKNFKKCIIILLALKVKEC